jgi:hypothetical protein
LCAQKKRRVFAVVTRISVDGKPLAKKVKEIVELQLREQQPLAASGNNGKDRRRETDFPEDRRDESDDEGEGGAVGCQKRMKKESCFFFSCSRLCTTSVCQSVCVFVLLS